MKRVLKWNVWVNDEIQTIGSGPVLYVGSQGSGNIVQVWTEEGEIFDSARRVQVFGTGRPVPDEAVHLGTAIISPFVWHVYEVK